ncbi:class I SAM-dependent methyltransferase [Nocardioides sp. IC4_145]|uniref:class I SAM-dependent methyltransferase n=1 Tax=Nocardioides sp. IC4_145 TaxID=2714037 RepID=UPI00140B79F9|nr:class I SAM-dependent methyltransferase [Nocardioides sp. IC4_145]NHC24121.1 class I SAM-dependent methyltransferase [Nocardioides sp. IC4_145]
MPNNEFGDFQTPLALAMQCLRVMGLPEDARVLEPTCGLGSFMQAAATLSPNSERVGLERHPDYVARASEWGRVREANVFHFQLARDISWNTSGPLFVVGNPPWVTSAELNRMDSGNLPAKENFKGAKGFDAMLGSSNFDVCEYIILKALNEHQAEPFTLGMLCKTQVARNVIEYAASTGLPIRESALYRIDAMKWFNAGVDACWFVVSMDPREMPQYTADVYDDVFAPDRPAVARFGVVDGLMVSDVDRYEAVRAGDGTCPYVWRSGLKHDASQVFELVATPSPATKSGQTLDLEADYVLPFLKSTDIFRGRHRDLSKWVIVPQKTFGAETAALEHLAPKLWGYLTENAAALDGRKSSIYRNRPRFSVFGHGDYTYAPYKVAISGLHKQPVFRLVPPLNGQPVVLDDTCYLLPFDDATEAALVTAILNSDECRALVESMVFWDSKRPITKKLLARLDVNRIPFDRDLVREQAAKIAADADLPFDEERAETLFKHLGGSAPEETLF